MNEESFAQLVESIKQAGAIRRGECAASRSFEVTPLDSKAIRARLNKSLRKSAEADDE